MVVTIALKNPQDGDKVHRKQCSRIAQSIKERKSEEYAATRASFSQATSSSSTAPQQSFYGGTNAYTDRRTRSPSKNERRKHSVTRTRET